VLHLVNNNISDLTPLAGLTHLPATIWVLLHGNPITDWFPINHVLSVGGRHYADYTTTPYWLINNTFETPYVRRG